ncbi:hypothetical protein MRB53_029499 [Persea americana]|uniref:Uncharacterized protein n=1 Tax=Persea americana TaxID=3435 RepID=A0ACC2KIL3_PERAE|nr:hypothetical protein MRB53_029499 [Persea americana]
MADRSRRPVIGIDLGTTYSCAGVWRNSRVEIIPNDQGNKTTPSFVAFTGTKRFIGEDAEHQSTRNPQNTVFDDNVRSKDKMKIQCLIKPTEEWLKKGGKLVDGDKFRREYEEHASYFHEALEIARNSSKNSAWTRVGKALSVAVSTILPIVVPIVVGISTS